MSDELLNVNQQHVFEFTNKDFPEEKLGKDGMNIPDPSFIDNITEEGKKQIEQRREEVSNLPKYPSEWQENYSDDGDKGFNNDFKLPVNVTLKEKEINKLIRKYKRYMKSNLREIRRVENDD